MLIWGALVADGAGRPAIVRLAITVQACDDERCLKPEELVLELPVPGEAPAGRSAGGATSRLGSPPIAMAGAVTGLVAVAAAAWWLWWQPAHAA